MSWQPSEQGLRDLLTCIEQSSSTDNAVQKQVRQRFELFNEQVADFNSYLTYVLVNPIPGVSAQSRAVAGFMLVNNLRARFASIPAPVIDYIKQVIFQGLQDESTEVRRATSTVLTWLIRSVVPENWADGLHQLFQLLNSPSVEVQESTISTFSKLCADVPKSLERVHFNGQPFLDYLVPALMDRLESENTKIRSQALVCLVPFIEPESDKMPPNALMRHIDHFIAALFNRASDPSSAVRKQVCTAIVALLSSRPAKIAPEINGVVDYVLHCTQDPDKDLALEACEFWLTFAEDPELVPLLEPFLPRVAPVLLDCTVYEEDELFALGALDADDDAAVPDKPEDMKPQFYSSKVHSQNASTATLQPENAGDAATSKSRDSSAANAAIADGADDDDDDDDLDDDDEDYSEWTLRKCAAAALDVLATSFEAQLLPIVLPHLKNKLQSPDWLQRESGILTLGAMAEGCITHLNDHLPALIPYFLQSLSDPKPLVRSIACWTIGRYSAWLIDPSVTPEHKQTYFVPAMDGLLRMLLDNNKRVQEAGCSAFATLEEEAASELEPFLDPVLRGLAMAFGKYQRKNLLILYDAIGTLADSVGEALNRPEYVEIIMPPLIHKWQSLQDDEEDLIPLLECMSSVVIAVGRGFLPHAAPVFERCVRIVHTNLVHTQTWQQNPSAYDIPDKTFLIVALDLLSGLTQGLGDAIIPLYQNMGNQTFQLLLLCMQHPEAPVRQSAYALLGDCAISVFPLLKPHLPQIMPLLAAQIQIDPKPEQVSVCNNATWAAGELALKLGAEMEPYVNELMNRLMAILASAKAARSLSENAAVTIGRLGLVCPVLVAPHLDDFGLNWCQALAEIKDNDEKDSAFRGFCMVIQANPNGIAKNFQFFLNAVARWNTPSHELNEMFRTILCGFKDLLGQQWAALMGSMPQAIRVRLNQRYGV